MYVYMFYILTYINTYIHAYIHTYILLKRMLLYLPGHSYELLSTADGCRVPVQVGKGLMFPRAWYGQSLTPTS